MKSLSGVGLGLSLVFGCLLLALLGELYYLLWWKKRRICEKTNENGDQIPSSKNSFMFCCWIKPTQELCASSILVHEPQSNSNKDFAGLGPFGEGNLENFSGPPRFLFTITEETKEDMESEDGIIRNGKNSTSRSSLGDFIQILETPFLTPIASSPYFTPPLTPSNSYDQHHTFGPFFESKSDAAFNKLRSSPPPKFKFLRDAEEKLVRRGKLLQEIEKGVLQKDHRCASSAPICHKDEENGSFITIIIANGQEEDVSKNSEQHEQEMGRMKYNSKKG